MKAAVLICIVAAAAALVALETTSATITLVIACLEVFHRDVVFGNSHVINFQLRTCIILQLRLTSSLDIN